MGIIAPASPPDELKLARGIFLELRAKGEKGKYINSRYGYLAAHDHERVEDIHHMFQDPDVKAVICACGGYGTGRIAEAIDYDLIRRNPKIFGDTVILRFTYSHSAADGSCDLHGPMLSSDVGLEEVHPYTKDTFYSYSLRKPFRIRTTCHLFTLLSWHGFRRNHRRKSCPYCHDTWYTF